MPACTARYRCRLIQSKDDPDTHFEIVRFVEEREPDEWGDPGRLISRRAVGVEAPCEVSWMDHLTRQARWWHLDIREQVGPVEWMD
jgi:hypothetical protein